ncbi:ATP-dependent DNA helicase RecG [Pelagirhabdus alkalitolerans]|uniref:ATP-dependent DNA helicase RecG n=2 Tax=Pelagirhabdus alkalitolerans TaxID=1612202 RepID=A0A1G6H262_9BACI|nr:ATP-dependent DNA helicase RecG [Pelagirhabdus alkalitolerans]
MMERAVTEISGVGPKMAENISELGIKTVDDLINTFPSRYEHFEVLNIRELVHDQNATLEGVVLAEAVVTFFGKKKNRLTVPIQVEDVVVKVVMFNRAFAKKQLIPNQTVTVTGKWDQHRQQITASHYKVGKTEDEPSIQPVYLLRQVIGSGSFKKLVSQAFKQFGDTFEETIPSFYKERYKLLDRKSALLAIHFPSDVKQLKQAKRRLIYEELLMYQLKMQTMRQYHKTQSAGHAKQINSEKVNAFIENLPFHLTDAQKKAWGEIRSDLISKHRMHRLLQGDVGSGKTAVAAIALYSVITVQKQGAIMVPTEILAEQHAQSFDNLFGDLVNIALLTGSVKGKKRKQILERIQNGEIDLVVGTHALIQNDVHFSDLGLVIVDEQHRFGVNQRKVLREKAMDPDVLFMTATPIPRTLAITSYGDMDMSIINQMPQGRKPVETYWVKESVLPRILKFIEKEVQHNHQAYVIAPLIEESDKLDIQNAVDLYQHLEIEMPDSTSIGLLHGRLTNQEKEEMMHQFAENQLNVLVATTVVEVGVNVPNATVMVIYDAERFGLSQLHQLRGRVGRGDAQSYCILIADPKGEVGKRRMQIMTETSDGFILAEEDLKLRGPGDFFGKKQSGLPDFQLADPAIDYRTLETARQDAVDIISSDLLTEDLEYRYLNHFINKTLKEQLKGFD